MNKEQLLKLVDSLDLPKEEYYILSSGCLLLYGLRKTAKDLDLCVSTELFKKMIEKFNIDLSSKSEYGFYQLNNQVEIVVNDKKEFKRKFKDGYPVEPLESILQFKIKRNALKDQEDIINIQNYLKNGEWNHEKQSSYNWMR